MNDFVKIKAPGRVNLIGEHTDYNDGFVLPAAIDRYIYLSAKATDNGLLSVKALDLGEIYIKKIDHLKEESTRGFYNYVAGVVSLLQDRFGVFPGVEIEFQGTIPIGLGLSSSAALEVATAVAASRLFSLDIADIDLVKLCQQAEWEFAKVQCGIMDQYASYFGKENQAILLDCLNLNSSLVPLWDYRELTLIVVNSGVSRRLSSSQYNVRRNECKIALLTLKEHKPEIKSLRDITAEDLKSYRTSLPEILYQRVKHVVEENQRVHHAVKALLERDYKKLGELLFQSHNSLKELYQVSIPRLDEIVEISASVSGVYGARMIGAGFGGCVLILADPNCVEKLTNALIENYFNPYSLPAEIFGCKIVNGAKYQ